MSSVDPDGSTTRSFANTGTYIDIAAPGQEVLSTYPGGGYVTMSGTSMAAPFVSAAAALVRSANPTLSGPQVSSVLLSTAQDDSSGDGKDSVFGYGLLRADLATAKAAGDDRWRPGRPSTWSAPTPPAPATATCSP